jgi:hypothetical protein
MFFNGDSRHLLQIVTISAAIMAVIEAPAGVKSWYFSLVSILSSIG